MACAIRAWVGYLEAVLEDAARQAADARRARARESNDVVVRRQGPY